MFSTAGNSGSNWPDWNTNPKALRRSLVQSASGSLAKSVPRKLTFPAVGLTMPANTCNRVDFPEPDGPMTAMLSPARMAKFTWLSASICMAGATGFAVPG